MPPRYSGGASVEFLTKPIDQEKLLNAVKKAIAEGGWKDSFAAEAVDAVPDGVRHPFPVLDPLFIRCDGIFVRAQR